MEKYAQEFFSLFGHFIASRLTVGAKLVHIDKLSV
jgi:hypothetical protein